jgi:hypothetical protein
MMSTHAGIKRKAQEQPLQDHDEEPRVFKVAREQDQKCAEVGAWRLLWCVADLPFFHAQIDQSLMRLEKLAQEGHLDTVIQQHSACVDGHDKTCDQAGFVCTERHVEVHLDGEVPECHHCKTTDGQLIKLEASGKTPKDVVFTFAEWGLQYACSKCFAEHGHKCPTKGCQVPRNEHAYDVFCESMRDSKRPCETCQPARFCSQCKDKIAYEVEEESRNRGDNAEPGHTICLECWTPDSRMPSVFSQRLIPCFSWAFNSRARG